ncbi:MAG: glycosyltransferase [Ahrensia sp.]|nr:glycosyltransferase [Ahrensia sp.]
MTALFAVNDLAYFRAHRQPLAEALVDRGYRVILLADPARVEPVLDGDPWELRPVSVERHRLNIVKDAKLALAIAKLVRNEKPDLLHLLTIKPVLFGALATAWIVSTQQRRSLKSVWTFPGLGTLFAGSSSPAKRRFVEFALKLCAKRLKPVVTTENTADSRRLANGALLGTGIAPSTLNGTGLDLEHFRPAQCSAKKGMLVFGLAARLLKAKGVGAFLHAAEVLSGKAKFVLAGLPAPGNPDAFPLDQIHKAVSRGHVEFHEGVSQRQMPSLLRSIDVFCLPTTYPEGLPRSLIEAAACGCALIATDQESIKRLVEEDKTGWLIGADQTLAAQLAKRCENAIANPDKARAMGKAASVHIRGLGVSDQDVINQFLTLYGLETNPS